MYIYIYIVTVICNYVQLHRVGEGNGNPLQLICLENSMDRGTWWAVVHGVAKRWTRLSERATMCAHRARMLTSLQQLDDLCTHRTRAKES